MGTNGPLKRMRLPNQREWAKRLDASYSPASNKSLEERRIQVNTLIENP
jgi:hypothetical protein